MAKTWPTGFALHWREILFWILLTVGVFGSLAYCEQFRGPREPELRQRCGVHPECRPWLKVCLAHGSYSCGNDAAEIWPELRGGK